MSLHETLYVLGCGLLGLAGVLLVVTARFFVTRDIRGVWDDLSGRHRQRDLAAHVRYQRREAPSPAVDVPVRPVAEPRRPQVAAGVADKDADEVLTVLAAADDEDAIVTQLPGAAGEDGAGERGGPRFDTVLVPEGGPAVGEGDAR